MQDHHLIVTRDFAGYKRGDRIEETAEIDRLLGGELSAHVIRVLAPVTADVAVEPKSATVPPPVDLAPIAPKAAKPTGPN